MSVKDESCFEYCVRLNKGNRAGRGEVADDATLKGNAMVCSKGVIT